MRMLRLTRTGLRISARVSALVGVLGTPVAAQQSAAVTQLVDSLSKIDIPASGFVAAQLPASAEPGRLTMVIRIDDGRWIPPHTHNLSKTVRVVSGVLRVGHGTAVGNGAQSDVAAGDSVVVPPNHAHYEGARGRTFIVITAAAGLTTTWIPKP